MFDHQQPLDCTTPTFAAGVTEPANNEDPLSSLVDALGLRVALWRTGLESPWRIRMEPRRSAFCFVSHGHCRVDICGRSQWKPLERGDLLVVLRSNGCVLRDDPRHAIASTAETRGRRGTGTDSTTGPVSDTAAQLIGGTLSFDASAAAVVGALPDYILARRVEQSLVPWLGDALHQAYNESFAGRNGTVGVANHLAEIALLYALRDSLNTDPGSAGAWLSGVADPQIGPTLARMHEEPQEKWSLERLASEAGMSRSSFAARFAAQIGTSPMQYLLACRMRRACRLLTTTRRELKQIARNVGYNSAAAFSTAFKRWSDRWPGAYRREAAPGDGKARETPDV